MNWTTICFLTQGQFRVYQHGNMDVEQKKQTYQVVTYKSV